MMKDREDEPFKYVKSDKEGNPDNDIILTVLDPTDEK